MTMPPRDVHDRLARANGSNHTFGHTSRRQAFSESGTRDCPSLEGWMIVEGRSSVPWTNDAHDDAKPGQLISHGPRPSHQAVLSAAINCVRRDDNLATD